MDAEILEQPLNPDSLKQVLAFLNKNGLTTGNLIGIRPDFDRSPSPIGSSVENAWLSIYLFVFPSTEIAIFGDKFTNCNQIEEAEEALKREASAVLRLSKEPLDGTDVNNDAVMREYGSLLSHVDASFDNFRAELSSLLFPVFAHLYIQLIFEGHSTVARMFGEKYARSVPSMYEEPTRSLLRISTHSQAVTHPTVHALTKNQFVVRMSKSAIKQLEPLLARNPTIKEIIHDHIVIEPLDATRTKAAVEASLGGILGQISKQDRKHKMYYGTVKEDFSSQLGVDKKRLKGKDRADSKKKDANGPAPDRIPLPTICERRSYLNKESSKKVGISAESPPSVCLYTALNASGGLTAADFADDGSCLALGYGNSVVQVPFVLLLSLNEEKLCPLKKIEQLEALEVDSDDIFDHIYDESQGSTQLSFQGHTGPVYSVSLAPDKRLLLSSSSDATVRLWNIATRSNVVVYRQTVPIWQAQFCSRSYYFATASSDGTAAVWTTDRLQPVRIFADAFSDVSCIDFHPNCNYVVGGSDDRYVRVWDMLSGSCVRTFSSHKAPIRAVKVSPCGRYLASVSAEGSLVIWDMGMQKALCSQEVPPCPFMSTLAFSRDGSALAFAQSDCALSFYSVDSLTSHANPQEHSSNDPKINPNGFHMFTYATKQTPIVGLHFLRRDFFVNCCKINTHRGSNELFSLWSRTTRKMSSFAEGLTSPEVEIAEGGAIGVDNKARFADLKTMLDSSKDSLKVDAMKRIINLVAKGRDVSELFPAVVKNVAAKNLELKKLVYVYLVRYAEEQQDLALLSISTFQRALKDPNQLIRASALRVLSSIRVPMIAPIMLLAIRESVRDMSAYVRKVAAHAIPKLYALDEGLQSELVECIDYLLGDKRTLVLGSAVYAFEETCPDRFDILHAHFRSLCKVCPSVLLVSFIVDN
ncbi:unnamed protein product [Anisakis simplex]|uniref:WD_REPEATS_REGION domain-containing protein n=1 Tax=Anisakis simplex TaxID=6269 RepID=A0A0M3JUQ8_ANISI|nr:unnamed protein product [Anisakis simplex]